MIMVTIPAASAAAYCIIDANTSVTQFITMSLMCQYNNCAGTACSIWRPCDNTISLHYSQLFHSYCKQSATMLGNKQHTLWHHVISHEDTIMSPEL